MGSSVAGGLSLAATGLSAAGKLDAGDTAAQNAYGQAANAQAQASSTNQYDRYQAKFLSNAAETGRTAAAETDADMQMQLQGKLATYSAIRGATGTESGTTDAALANRTTEVSDINRAQTVANIQAQSAQDQLSASYYRSAGITALKIGQMQADQYAANAQADETSGMLGAGGTVLSALSGLASNTKLLTAIGIG